MSILVNSRSYKIPCNPVVVVCVDGFAPDYLQVGLQNDAVPYLASLHQLGLVFEACSAMPSFTNPNNVSIVTGAPPAVHGISGNYFLDPATLHEVMMNEPEFLRCDTILAAFAHAGKRITTITAKDKLCRILGHGLPMNDGRHVCFSMEKVDQTTTLENGLGDAMGLISRKPQFYSTETSMAVLDAGIALLRQGRADILYLSTTDYIQHMYAPEEPEALDFMRQLDSRLAKLHELGCILVVTADHGMNSKTLPNGAPDVLYLKSLLDQALPDVHCRVILPVTDPYVAHHGSLGSFATIYVEDFARLDAVHELLSEQEEIEEVVSRAEATARFEVPPDRIGDLCIVAHRQSVLGKEPEDHDLSQLHRPLRSHGGLHEQRVPLIVNRPVNIGHGRGLRNFDAFHLACNYCEPVVREA
jgi:phosphonoacetate hydrolase